MGSVQLDNTINLFFIGGNEWFVIEPCGINGIGGIFAAYNMVAFIKAEEFSYGIFHPLQASAVQFLRLGNDALSVSLDGIFFYILVIGSKIEHRFFVGTDFVVHQSVVFVNGVILVGHTLSVLRM